MKQIVIHVVVVARTQHSGCFNAYNGIKDAWKCLSDLIVSVFIPTRPHLKGSVHLT